MKILLTEFYSAKNKGDLGITIGTIRTLINDKKADVKIFSLFKPPIMEEQELATSINGDTVVIPIEASAYPSHIGKTKPIIRIWRLAIGLIHGIYVYTLCRLLGLRANSLLSKRDRTFVSQIQTSDLLISLGGHRYYAENPRPIQSLLSLEHLFRMAFPLILGTIYKKPIVFLSQSFGPFRSAICRGFMSRLLRSATMVCPRESTSKREIQLLGVPDEATMLVPDAAFALQAQETSRTSNILQDINKHAPRFFAVTVRNWYFPGNSNPAMAYQHYIDEISGFCDHIIEKYNINPIFMPQVVFEAADDDDREASQLVINQMRNKSRAMILTENLDPEELLAIYGHADFMVGTRFHSVIFSLTAGTPCISISYSGYKATGIMQDLELDRFVIPISEVNREVLIQMAEDLMVNRDSIRNKIKIGVASMKERLNLFKEAINPILQRQ
jgi:colanic acid/amylovoran biosynthesis protein